MVNSSICILRLKTLHYASQGAVLRPLLPEQRADLQRCCMGKIQNHGLQGASYTWQQGYCQMELMVCIIRIVSEAC